MWINLFLLRIKEKKVDLWPSKFLNDKDTMQIAYQQIVHLEMPITLVMIQHLNMWQQKSVLRSLWVLIWTNSLTGLLKCYRNRKWIGERMFYSLQPIHQVSSMMIQLKAVEETF